MKPSKHLFLKFQCWSVKLCYLGKNVKLLMSPDRVTHVVLSWQTMQATKKYFTQISTPVSQMHISHATLGSFSKTFKTYLSQIPMLVFQMHNSHATNGTTFHPNPSPLAPLAGSIKRPCRLQLRHCLQHPTYS